MFAGTFSDPNVFKQVVSVGTVFVLVGETALDEASTPIAYKLRALWSFFLLHSPADGEEDILVAESLSPRVLTRKHLHDQAP